jgi:hypothetical protein
MLDPFQPKSNVTPNTYVILYASWRGPMIFMYCHIFMFSISATIPNKDTALRK